MYSEALNKVTGTVTARVLSSSDTSDKDASGFKRRTCCINYTNVDVTVVDREGLRYVIPNTPHRYTGFFVIRTTYEVRREHFDNLSKLFSSMPDELDGDMRELYQFRDQFRSACVDRNNNTVTIHIDTMIEQSALKESHNVYVSSKDIVLSTKSLLDAPAHPFSRNSLLMAKYEQLVTNRDGLHFFIEIVDNDDQMSARYMYAYKRLFKVNPHKDPMRENGVYLGVGETDSNGKAHCEITRLPLAEAGEALGLYPTREEAVAAGDIKSLRQEEISTQTHKNLLLKMEIEQLLAAHKAAQEVIRTEAAANEARIKKELLDLQTKNQIAENEARIAQSEREQDKIALEERMARMKARFEEDRAFREDQYNREKLRREEEYDARSHKRKESLELVKWIPSVIAAVLGIYIAVQKTKSNK